MIPKAQTTRLDALFGHGAAADAEEPPVYDPFAPPVASAGAIAGNAAPRGAIPLHISVQADEPARHVVNRSVKEQVITHLSDDAVRRRILEEILPADFDADAPHLETARQIADAVLRIKVDLVNAPWMERLTQHDGVSILSTSAMVGVLLRDDLAPGIYRSVPPDNRVAELEIVGRQAEDLHTSLLNAGYALAHVNFLPPPSRLFSAMAKVDQALLDDTQNCFTPAVRAKIAQRVVQVAATAGIFAGFARSPLNPETLAQTAPIEALAVGGGAMNTSLAIIMKDIPKLSAALKPEAFPTILKNCENPATEAKVVARALEILEEDQWIPRINMAFRHLFPSDFPVNLSAIPRIVPETTGKSACASESIGADKAAPKKEDVAPC